ncbi:hypothetical protein RhiirA1_469288 [Rhizophagus irregularis]|uniref:Uncharacterized protein n=1 Tax=Rhizophagus irregularis TaxID=588596 RepID=A0A2N0R8B3_9GLOM|nr:hypothetical protein RhiirA1_469288 [Rhizophagus irregularis]
MQSEIDLLRQHFTELEVKYTKIKAEKAELEAVNAEIPELRKKFAELEAKNVELVDENTKLRQELRSRIKELEKSRTDTDVDNARRDVEIAEIKAEVVKLAEGAVVRDNNEENKELISLEEVVNAPCSVADQPNNAEQKCLNLSTPVSCQKSLEDEKTDVFLDGVHKKMEIRQRNREKKLCTAPSGQRESAHLLINPKSENNESYLCEEKGDQALEGSDKHISFQETSPTPIVRKIPYNQKVEQGIIQEVISFIQKRALTSSINILESREIETVSADGEGRDLAQLFSDAKVAEGRTLEAKRRELVCWYNYSESYQNKVAEICSKTGVAEKTAKSQVYAMIKASLPNVSDSNLYKKTERAGSVYKLFGKIIDPATKKEVMGIGIDKVYGISYGVRGISELSDAQILNIINRVAEKARDILTNGQEQNHVTEISEKILPIPEENLSLSADVDGYINMLTGSLDDETDNWGTPYENSARIGKEEANEVKLEDEVPPGPENVPSDSSGDSKGIGPDDLPKSQVSIPSTSSSDQISKSNRSGLPVSILPEDPEEKRKHIIGLVLEKFPYLSLDDSDERLDTFNLDGSTLCPLCNGDHKVNRSIFDEIKGEWGAGEYYGERTYRLKCRESFKPGIPIVSVKA